MRDPRIDPRAGDVVRKKGHAVRVLGIEEFGHSTIVRWERFAEMASGVGGCELNAWLVWCRGAEVLIPHPDSRAAELTGAD